MYLRQVTASRRHASDQRKKLFSSGAGNGQRDPQFKSVWGRIGSIAFVVGVVSIGFLGATTPPAHGATPGTSGNAQEQSTPKRALPLRSDIEPHGLSLNPACIDGTILSEKICVYGQATDLQIDFTGFLVDGYGVIEVAGLDTGTSFDGTVHWSTTNYVYTAVLPSDLYEGTACALETIDTSNYLCDHFLLRVTGTGGGYRLSAADGAVFGAGNAVEYGSFETSAAVDPVVGIASTPDGKGYWEVTRDGDVARFGDAGSYSDLPNLHVNVDDIVAIAPTSNGKGYWLVGADGGEFAFGDADYHGSLPGLHIHVDDIVGMVATPNGNGYVLVGRDGGVFVFGGRFFGSLPGLHIRVSNIVGIIPTGAETGYVLVGSDGGSFVFGTGSGFYGSLPGRQVRVSDVVGIALTPDQHGYWMVGANAVVYNFGDASYFGTPAYAASNTPITGIAAT